MNGLRKTVLPLLASFLWFAGDAAAQSSYSLRSPDKRIEIRIRTGAGMQYDVLLNGKVLLQNSTLSINIDQTQLGRNVKVKGREGTQRRSDARAAGAAEIREDTRQLQRAADRRRRAALAVVFRAYNEGAAYRLETSLAAAQVKVYGEEAGFNFAGDYTVYYPQEESFFSHNERQYTPRKLKAIAPAAIASLPAVVDETASRSRSPNPTLRTTLGCGCAAPAATVWRRCSRPTR